MPKLDNVKEKYVNGYQVDKEPGGQLNISRREAV